MRYSIIDFGMGVMIGGLTLSACWGWLWLIIGTVGLARGACSRRVVMNSLVVGISPLVLGWGVWWLRAEAVTTILGLTEPEGAHEISSRERHGGPSSLPLPPELAQDHGDFLLA